MKILLSLSLLLIVPHAASAARGDLVSSRFRYRITAAEAAAAAAPFGKVERPCAIDLYELEYRTLDGKGREVTASGAVAVPGCASPAPMVSVQHGTVFERQEVPSRLPPYRLGSGLAFAASGYVALMPDYVGYGVSSASFHPYLHAASLAASVVDMIRAGRRFMAEKSIRTDGRLFLLGYSEGGYATLAAHREIELRHSNELKVTASAPIAGPYDLEVTMDVLMRRESPASVPYLAFAFWAYDRIYGLDRLRGIVREPYRSRVLRLFDLSTSAQEIYAGLPLRASDLFEPDFLRSWKGEGAHRVKKAARENGLAGWKPVAPVHLFHCREDTVVPVEVAVAARDAMVRRGASDVRLVERDLGDHGACFGPLMAEAKSFFDSFLQGR
jgi:hypothetical protein